MERLQKIIARSGRCSRRKAEELIKAGRVSVDGIKVDSLGFKAEEKAKICIDGVPIDQEEEKVVYLLNKPKNIISAASDDRGRKTVCDLIVCDYRLFPLGRLDYDSSGLILLSNDGELMQKLIHPKYEVKKTYEVTIDGLISAEEIRQLETGVEIDGRLTAPCQAVLKKQNDRSSFLELSIHEGRNRQIRKMFANLGYEVRRLHRISEATVELGDLKSGEYRRLKAFEVKKLKKYLDRGDL